MIPLIWGLAGFITVLLMAIGHYFPWPDWLRRDVANRIFNHVWGVSGVMIAAYLLATLTHRNYVILTEVFILFVVAGATTVACYGYDHYRDTNNRGKRRERTNGK